MTDQERELLVCLMEEAAEVVLAVAKALRHGLTNHHPQGTELNIHAVARECGEFNDVMHRLVHIGCLDNAVIAQGKIDKSRNLDRWLHGRLA